MIEPLEGRDAYKVIVVTGWRDATDEDRLFIEEHLRACRGRNVTTLFHGAARGVDKIAKHWANRTSLAVRGFKAQWAFYGNAAGPARNEHMVRMAVEEFGADKVLGVAFPHRTSIGTLDCMRKFEHFKVHYERYELRVTT